MVCKKEINIKNKWDHYCTGLNLLFKNDTILGFYIGCPCKTHDINYSKEGTVNRKTADLLLRKNIQKQGIIQDRKVLAFFVSWFAWLIVRSIGRFIWKTWSSLDVPRYQ